RDLPFAVLGASGALVQLWRDAGMRALYIGDEGVIDTRSFSLEGRAIRKVRQSVSRLERSGFHVELTPVEELDAGTIAELDRVSDAWRCGRPERGFSMALDGIETSAHDCVVIAARDGDGAVRGFLQFAPAYGRNAA